MLSQSDNEAAYGFENIEEYIELSTQNILARIPDAVLWRHYIGSSFQLHKTISAPYRNDPKPSFQLYYDRRERIMFKDHGRAVSGDIFDYIKLAYNISFRESVQKVNCDFDLRLGGKLDREYCQNSLVAHKVTRQEINKLEKFRTEFVKRSASLVQARLRKYERADLDYWAQFGINWETLKLYNVYCVEKLFINKNLQYTHDPKNPGYAYHFPKSDHLKCYFPLSTECRFYSNTNNYEDIQGYYQCRVKVNYPNKVLILTKSLKDCMLLHQFGFDAVAIHGEGQYFNQDFIRHIKKYYPRIISLYDRDRTGIKGAKYLWKQFCIPPYFINKKYKAKDISDVYKEHGEETVLEILKKITEEKKGLIQKF